MLVAVDGPALATNSVYWMLWPCVGAIAFTTLVRNDYPAWSVAALAGVTAKALVLGIDSDRVQQQLAAHGFAVPAHGELDDATRQRREHGYACERDRPRHAQRLQVP